MTNFIFKSASDLQKIRQQLLLVLSELRFQRSEHQVILRKLNLLLNQKELEDQASKYYEKYGEDETSPQTDTENNDSSTN